MKSSVILIGLLIVIQSTFAQLSRTPGGVKGAAVWYVVDTFKNEIGFRSLSNTNPSFIPVNSTKYITEALNFQPALRFASNSHLRIPLDGSEFNSASFFTVYEPNDSSKEDHIWHITRNLITEMVFTDKRMADLSLFKYMNFIDRIADFPKVGWYIQQKEKDSLSTSSRVWYLGSKPSSPSLPVTSFIGIMPEIIAYDRVLSQEERLRVASYLALKYGITLTEPGATYLNSAGTEIWNGYDYEDYHHNIAGIGRDDSSSLYLQKSISSNGLQPLTISASRTFSNLGFVLWGDNGKALRLDEKTPGMPTALQKKWVVVPTLGLDSISTDIQFDSKQIDAPLSPRPVFWLAIDRSGKSEFASPDIEFKRMSSLSGDGIITFNAIKWDLDGSGRDNWALIPGQELLTTVWVESPSCRASSSGNMTVRINGGVSPYEITLYTSTLQTIKANIRNNSDTMIFSGLVAGRYRMMVRDMAGNEYHDSIVLSNSDGPFASSVLPKYHIEKGRPVVIDASVGLPGDVLFRWIGPSNFSSSNPRVTLIKPGTYTLTCTRNGCSNQKEIKVTREENNIIKTVLLYPNPSPGKFFVKIALERVESISMSIYTIDGKLVYVREFSGFSNYNLTHHLVDKGAYTVVFKSGESIHTEKIIIAK